MSAAEPDEGKVQWGHFILRVQRERRGRSGFLFLVEDVRTGKLARYDRLEEALAFIQSHLSPEDEQG
jgi:hypothetical protein